jgi:hypothetical protein
MKVVIEPQINGHSHRIVRHEICPVCNGAEGDDIDGMAPRKTTGYHYIKHAAAAMNQSVTEIVEQIRVKRCRTCGCFYCDPWLSPELASQIFCVGAPDHIAGWRNFEHWISSSALNVYKMRNRRLYDKVISKIGTISSYAEFGCPFQGFLLTMRGIEIPKVQARIELFAASLQRANDDRWSHFTKIYNKFECGIRYVLVIMLRLRSWKYRMDQDQIQWKFSQIPTRRIFFTEDTVSGWGSNCVRYGSSCRYFANQVLAADVLPLPEAPTAQLNNFSLIGIFNFLDHTKSPLDVIQKCLKLSPHLLLVTHRASHAGRQHPYAFGDDFATWLKEFLSNVLVTDLSIGDENLTPDYNYILISKVDHK